MHINTTQPDTRSETELIRETYSEDPIAKEVESFLRNPGAFEGKPNPKFLQSFTTEDGLLRHNVKVYVPKNDALRIRILQQCHDPPTVGQSGIDKTIDLARRTYTWPGLTGMVTEYVRTCDVCGHIKPNRHRPYGLLQPLPVPARPWDSISVDFITDLPESEGNHLIMVIVDRFSKMVHFVPHENSPHPNARQCADILFKTVLLVHGRPSSIVSDRDSVFTSNFWTRLTQLPNRTKIVNSLSSAD